MAVQSNLQKPIFDTQQLNALIIDSIQDKKGKKILKLDLRHLQERPADYFIICEADSPTQIHAIIHHIYRNVKDRSLTTPLHIEGISSGTWSLLDYFDTVVHVFYPETRLHYNLESLWSDAHIEEYEDVA